MTAMKNIKTSWLSREALALGIFTAMMGIVVMLYLIDIPKVLRVLIEAMTLSVGIYGIYAQSMIYRIKARPSWDRITTNMKFFGVGYVGVFLLALVALMFSLLDAVVPLLSIGMVGAVAQLFFSYEDLRTLGSEDKNTYQLKRTARLYDENFLKIKQFRFVSIIVAGIFLPLLVNVLLGSATFGAGIILGIAILIMSLSELSDRFLFYATVVPLGMAGGFFVGKQR
ncbi:MAG: dimethyl sulfoxide reductase anchor subunit, partial [Epsilonproteobacteria bacterium]|nr:dimethyl sulfoxide reductase anchor subunit [Campylobacterota bacterium]